jgi:putative transposase
MPRANRYFVPGHLWHITHRCHQRDFHLKFTRDRRRWRYWLYEARKRYGLCVLNYIVTSNHIHLLVKDTTFGTISKSMQLIAGRTAQEYNKRKNRKGAFWEDRYHATAIETGRHLARCLVYIDLNMVRAGVVSHPLDWVNSGYREIQNPVERYWVIDLAELANTFSCKNISDFQQRHRQWVGDALSVEKHLRDARWSESLAIGSEGYIESIKAQLAIRSQYRHKKYERDAFVLKEEPKAYAVNLVEKAS